MVISYALRDIDLQNTREQLIGLHTAPGRLPPAPGELKKEAGPRPAPGGLGIFT